MLKRAAPLILTLLVLAPTATAAKWVPGSLVTPPFDEVNGVNADVDRTGTVAVWGYGRDGVRWRERPIGGTFADAPARLKAGDQDVDPDYALAGDGRGSRVLAYNADGAMWLARKPAGKPFDVPVRIADGTDFTNDVSAAMGANGDVIVTWRSYLDGGAEELQAAVGHARGAAFDPPATLAAASGTPARIGFDERGNALIVWAERGVVKVARHPAGGGIEASRAIGAQTSSASEIRLAVSPRGKAALAYIERSYGKAFVTGALGSTTTGFDAPEALSGARARELDVAVADDRETAGAEPAAVTWRSGPGRTSRIRAALQHGDSWGKSLTLSGESASLPQVGVTRSGRTTVCWQRVRGAGRDIEYATRAGGDERFGRAERISGYGDSDEGPSLAVGRRGDQIVAWTRSYTYVEGTTITDHSGTPTRVQKIYRSRAKSGESVDRAEVYAEDAGAVALFERSIGDTRRFFDSAGFAGG